MASNPRTSLTVTFCPALGGGVLGRKKLPAPNKTDTPAATLNVTASDAGLFSQAIHPIISPATIQPIVPHIRMPANSFSALVTCFSVIAFTNARVGI